MQANVHILVIRFSAMGDVAMTVPVIKALLEQHPQVHVTVVSNAFLQPLFEGLDRCTFYPAHLKQAHKGIAGIYRLFRALKKQHRFDAIADLHAVLRSQLLTSFFKLSGKRTATINKGRKEKKALTRQEHKVLQPLTTTHERYAAVFGALGYPVKLHATTPVYTPVAIAPAIQATIPTSKPLIGVAPFAQHAEKMYPIEKMKAVVQSLSDSFNVLLFGAPGTEQVILEQWANSIESVVNLSGKMSLREELTVISNLKAMVSMDSANMHLASLYGVPVISIWGATHPFAGFYGWQQPVEQIVSVDLYCRPCSVFGNKTCFRGDHACMQQIAEADIVTKVNNTVFKLINK